VKTEMPFASVVLETPLAATVAAATGVLLDRTSIRTVAVGRWAKS
jgi:hypothetical protein